jgi:hypothetical protein
MVTFRKYPILDCIQNYNVFAGDSVARVRPEFHING